MSELEEAAINWSTARRKEIQYQVTGMFEAPDKIWRDRLDAEIKLLDISARVILAELLGK